MPGNPLEPGQDHARTEQQQRQGDHGGEPEDDEQPQCQQPTADRAADVALVVGDDDGVDEGRHNGCAQHREGRRLPDANWINRRGARLWQAALDAPALRRVADHGSSAGHVAPARGQSGSDMVRPGQIPIAAQLPNMAMLSPVLAWMLT